MEMLMSRRMECPWTGKRIYFSTTEAKRELKWATHNGMQFRIYKCKKCNYLHFTHSKKKREKPP